MIYDEYKWTLLFDIILYVYYIYNLDELTMAGL